MSLPGKRERDREARKKEREKERERERPAVMHYNAMHFFSIN